MTERQGRYREEVLIDQLMEIGDIEDQYLPVIFDDLLQAAREILRQEDQEARMHFDMLVVLYEGMTFPTDAGRWRYRAVPRAHANGMTGCSHQVEASSFRYAQAAAVAEHRLMCMGRGSSV